MATHHRATGQPLDKDTTQYGQDTDIPDDYHLEDMDNFETAGQENDTNLATLTWELDDLHHRAQARGGQPAEDLHHIEQQFSRLTIALCPSAPPEPLDDVLRQYIETQCSAQGQTNFTNTLLQDITIFIGNDATQLEDWLLDVRTTSELSAESRTKLTQARLRGLTHTFDHRSPYIRQKLGRH